MKKIFVILTAVVLALALTSCQKQSEQKAENNAPVVEAPKALEGVDVSMLALNKCTGCGMDLSQHAIADTMTYEGKLYGFCSAGCKEHFKADPAAALAKMEQEKSTETQH